MKTDAWSSPKWLRNACGRICCTLRAGATWHDDDLKKRMSEKTVNRALEGLAL